MLKKNNRLANKSRLPVNNAKVYTKPINVKAIDHISLLHVNKTFAIQLGKKTRFLKVTPAMALYKFGSFFPTKKKPFYVHKKKKKLR